MYIERLLSEKLKTLVQHFPAVAVTGARQVGKSTLVEHLFGHMGDTVVFDPVIDVENARQDPDLFLDNHPARPLILDEIQYCPDLVPALKRRIDQDRSPGRFILTGSQQWQVMKSLAESLAGRVVFLDLDRFCLAEMSGATPLSGWLGAWLDNPDLFAARRPDRLQTPNPVFETLWRGFLPEATQLPLDVVGDFHTAYFRTYVDRDVRLLTDVSDWQQFGRFVRLTAALTAQEVNYSQLGRDIGITPQTAKRWLALLTATFQWFELPAYSGNTIKRISGKPKGYLGDTGLACSVQAISSPRAIGGHPLWGPLFETAVVAELRKLCGTLSPAPQMYHWRTLAGAEVDIVVERDGVFFPIEVKANSHPSKNDARGLAAFRKTYPHLNVAPGLVIAPTDRFIRISENDYAIPWDIGIQREGPILADR
jgi:predicted AAA+ superfamily ATPase